jgi:methionine synthase I (cobalamin-dependent)
MVKKIDFLEKLQKKVLLFDGGMGTEIYNRGVFINKCYDELNLTDPNIIKSIHEDYKAAGADVIESNTYGANRFKLSKHGLSEKLYEINFQGVKIAKEVAGDDMFVAGAVGPLGVQIEPLGPIAREEAVEYFKEQIQPMIDAGADLIILETFIYPNELEQAVKAVKSIADIPIIAQMTIDENCDSLTGAPPAIMIKELEDCGADIIGVNCTVGPQVMLNWLEEVREHTSIPISVMPNAGKPRNVDGRNIYLTSPEYMGEYAKHFVNLGANIIGGCCGTGPEHIKKMKEYISSVSVSNFQQKITISKIKDNPDIEKIPQDKKSRLASRLAKGNFVTFVELLAPRGVSAKSEIEKAREMNYYGIDVINIPDGPRASARMSALSLALQIQRDVGIETVLHYVCRDRNVIGIQSDLLGAYALGVKNILAITGDPPKLGNYPDATGVFDVDAIGLVNILNRLNNGMDIAGNPIGNPTGFFIGVGANPVAVNMDKEIARLDWKVDAGAEYIVTQPIFDRKVFEQFMKRIEHIKIPVIAGLWPLTSIRNAEFMNNEVPGCSVPDEILIRLRKVSDSKEAGLAEGIKIAQEILRDIKDMINGVQISAPFGRVSSIPEVLDGI